MRYRLNADRPTRILVAVLAAAWVAAGCEDPVPVRPGAYLFGARVPHAYFLVAGRAEADQADGLSDAVRLAAGVGDVNLRGGLSALGTDVEEQKPPTTIAHGAVMDFALAETRGPARTRLTAGVLIARVRQPKTGEVVAAFAVTYEGHEDKPAAEASLQRQAAEYFRRRYSDTAYELIRGRMRVETFVPNRPIGTVLVGAVFADAVHPHRRFGRRFMSLREFSNQ